MPTDTDYQGRIEELEEEVRQLRALLLSRDELAGVRLSPTHRRLLLALGRRAGAPVASEVLMGAAWPDTLVSSNTLKVTIHTLRARLKEYGAAIETRRDYGYMVPAADWARLTGGAQ